MRIIFVIWFTCITVAVEGATYYACRDGNWNDTGTWSATQGGVSCGCIPGPGDDVVIDGYVITVTSDEDIYSIVLRADERDAEAQLKILPGVTLSVSGNVTVQSTKNIYQNIGLVVQGSLETGGDLIFNRTPNNNRNRELGMRIESGTVHVKGDLNFTYAGAAVGEQEPEIDMSGDAYLESQEVNFTKSGGGRFNILLSGTSAWNIAGSCFISDTGGSDFEFFLSDNAVFTAGSDLSVVKSGGEDLDFSLDGHSVMKVKGNLTIDWKGSDADGSDLSLHVTDDAALDVDGKLDIDYDDQRDNCDVLVELEGRAEMNLGTDGAGPGEVMNIGITKGQKLNIYLDGDSRLNVNGNCDLQFGGSDHFYITLNGKDAGMSEDAQLVITGDLSVSKQSGDAFKMALSEDAVFSVGGNVDIAVSGHDENAQHDEIELNDHSEITIDGGLSFFVDVPNNNNLVVDLNDHTFFSVGNDDGGLSSAASFEVADGYSLYFMIDDDARYVSHGDVSLVHAGNGNMHLDLNYYTPNDPAGGRMQVAGNLTVTKKDGDRFRLSASAASMMDVAGDFVYTSSGHDAGSTTDESLVLNGDAVLNIHGDFSMEMDNPEQNNDLALDLNDQAVLNTGSGPGNTSILNLTDGARLVLRLDGLARWNVNGDLQLICGNSAQRYDMGLNLGDGSSAQLNITGDFEMKNDKNKDLLRFVVNGAASLLDVGGDIDFRGALAANRVEIEVRNTAELSLGGNFLRNPVPDNYGILDCRDQSVVAFKGNKQQKWPLSSGGGSDGFGFQNITVDNTGNSAPQIILQEDVDYLPAGTRVQFVNGLIGTGDYIFQVNNNDPSAMASFNEHSYICGNLRRRVAGGGTYDFPVGSPDHYELATLRFPGDIGSATYVEARFTVSDENPVPSSPPLAVNGVEVTEFLDYGFWTLAADAGAPLYDITLVSRGHANGASVASQHAVFKRDAGVWASVGEHDNSTQSGSGTDPVVAKRSGLTGFSDFIIGRSADEPLPVEWCSFRAEAGKEKVVLLWETQTEVDNDYFSVERSANGRDFIEIARVKGTGNSKARRAYKASDHFPLAGISYYRLAQTDFDGSVRYSDMTVVRMDVGKDGLMKRDRFLFFPNPLSSGDRLTLLLDPAGHAGSHLEVKIAGITGAVRRLPVVRNGNRVTVETGCLKYQGIYLLFIESDDGIAVRKLIVK